MIAFVFPGQGSQSVGMTRRLRDTFPVVQEVLDAVDDTLGYALSKIMLEGPKDLLTETRNAQPALLAASLSVIRVLERETDFDLASQVHFLAGHSVGEYSALVTAGVFGLKEAIELLRLRGQAMQQAVPAGEGAMAALLGLSIEQLEGLPESEDQVCVIANDNAPGQVVVSGHKASVLAAVEWAKALGGKGVMLNVSGPFHSPLMESAQEVMAEVLQKCSFQKPRVPVITNWSGRVQDDPEILREHLIQQLTSRVRWSETMQVMVDAGVTHVYEVGTGNVLAGLGRRGMPGIPVSSLGEPQDIQVFIEQQGVSSCSI